MKTDMVSLKGKVLSKSFQMESGQKLTIGRGQNVDIQIFQAGLSRNQCSLEMVDDRFYLTDLDSRNGTFINGERIQREEVKAGDIIAMGDIEFEFRCMSGRRRQRADLFAPVSKESGHEVKERIDLNTTGLMTLSAEFQNVENLQRVQRDLSTIYRVGNMINGESNLNTLYERILDAIFEVVKSHRAFLFLAEAKSGQLKIMAKRENVEALDESTKARFSTTVVMECYKEGASILRANVLKDAQFGQAESVINQNISSVICVPLEAPEKILGTIYADNVGDAEPFERHELELLTAVGKQAGVAIQRAQFADGMRRLLYGSMSALVASIEAKDEYTRGHSERVTNAAIATGRAMELSKDQLDMLELAGFLHDVGKIGVPESVLGKPAPLTDEEFAIIKQHPRQGYNIVSNIEGAEEIADAVLHHHERWDGNGYPDGLRGEEISLFARILAVADSYDAMNSKRPYRNAMPMLNILNEIKTGADKQFDQKVVEVFLEEHESGSMISDQSDACDTIVET